MLKKTTRCTSYATKKNWNDYSVELRELGVKNTILDVLSYYADLDENTRFSIYNGDTELCSFSVNDFRKGNAEKVKLSFFEIGRIVAVMEISENYLATGEKLEIAKTENGEIKTKAEVVLVSREIKLVF